jgi:hypothetical protein
MISTNRPRALVIESLTVPTWTGGEETRRSLATTNR